MDPTDVNLLRPLVDPVSQEAGFKKLNEIVKRLRLKNDKGELITSIDIFNQDDDFLTHDDVFIKLNGGLGDFDDTNPIHDIMLLHLRATEEFEVGPEKNHPIMNIKVKYVIVDPELEERLIKEQRLNRRKVTRALDSLDKMSKSQVRSHCIRVSTFSFLNFSRSWTISCSLCWRLNFFVSSCSRRRTF